MFIVNPSAGAYDMVILDNAGHYSEVAPSGSKDKPKVLKNKPLRKTLTPARVLER